MIVRQVILAAALAGLLLRACGGRVGAQEQNPGATWSEGARAEVMFRASAPGSKVPSYTLRVREDGSGSYTVPVEGASGAAAQELTTPLTMSAKTAQRIFEETRKLRREGFGCASKVKGVADMGTKWIDYRGEEGAASCTYNYTENKTALDLTETFRGIALTLDEGRKLAFAHQYDRLALNEEMGTLYSAAQNGRALELKNIASVLQSLVNDEDVLEKVRVRAASLLKMAGVTS